MSFLLFIFIYIYYILNIFSISIDMAPLLKGLLTSQINQIKMMLLAIMKLKIFLFLLLLSKKKF